MTKISKRILSMFLCAALTVSLFAGLTGAAAAQISQADEKSKSEVKSKMTQDTPHSVPFTSVSVTDDFWSARQKQFICVTVPAGIVNVERSGGGISNFINASKMHAGEPYGAQQGALYVDSDVHKLVESMCYALQYDAQGDAEIVAAQQQIAAKLEEWIPYYQGAQEDDGYFDTYFTLAHPSEKWTDFNKHELYCAGHFYEAAVAHYRLTGGEDTRLFDMAVKNADYVESLFGVGKWKQVPGHQEIELALLKLANLCREIGVMNGVDYTAKADKYVALALFFLDTRGDHEDRHGTNLQPDMCQDDIPLTELTTAYSHAVRAGYMYSAMADVSIQSGDTKYNNALLALWDSVNTKTYATGGVGDINHHEGFGDDYYMPIDQSYCETCAGIANMMWNQRMNLLFGESKYADKMETALYNTILSGINLDGDRFFYHNFVSTAGRERVEWYGTACCPPNLMRTVLSIGGYIYAQQGRQISLNMYIGNEAVLSVPDGEFCLNVSTGFPWNGNTTVVFTADGSRNMSLRLRVPDWAKGANTATLNGAEVSAVPDADGYITLDRVWNDGDTVVLSFPMEAQAIPMVDGCTYTENYTAFRRGPIVYCAEGADNTEAPKSYYLPGKAVFTEQWVETVDGKEDTWSTRGLMKITTQDALIHSLSDNTPAALTFIPFYANANRGATPMEVYISTVARDRSLEYYAVASASFTNSGNSTDSVANLNDGNDSDASRWTAYDGSNVRSCPWVMYEFPQEVTLWGCQVKWYDDGGGVQVPNGLTIQYWDGSRFADVEPTAPYVAFPKNDYGSYSFAPIATTKIRLVIDNTYSKRAPGIVEWKLLGSTDVAFRKCVWDAEAISGGIDDGCITTWGGNQLGDFVDAAAAAEKGLGKNGSGTALSYICMTDSDSGDHVLQIDTEKLPGFDRDWSDGELFWYYVDASEYVGQVTLGIQLNWIDVAAGQPVLLWKGHGSPYSGGNAVDAWDNHGRVKLPAGYCGFVGLPLSGFTVGGTLDPSNIHTIIAYYAPPDKGGSYPKALYLDEFWVTAQDALPAVSVKQESFCKTVWDMEALASQFDKGGVSTWGDGLSLGDYVDISVCPGKGVNKSVALGYDYVKYDASSLNGSFALQIDTARMAGLERNWSGGELFWYWIDASEFTVPFDLSVELNWIDLVPGQPVLFWNGAGAPYSGGVTKNIWDNHARVTIPAGYRGFVGVPLSGYQAGGVLDLTDIHTIILYFDPKDTSDTYPKTLYFDHFCLTDAFSKPDIVIEGAEEQDALCKKVFDPDTVCDTFDSSTILTHYNDPLDSGIACAIIENGKGFDGSNALGYCFDGIWSTANGDNNLTFIAPAEVGFDTDWSRADLLWFWIDNTDYSEETFLRINLNWCTPENGTTFYLWDGEGEKVFGGAMVDAWGGSAGFGKIPLPNNYRGFIGIPLLAFNGLNFTQISTIILHLDASSKDLSSLPKTVWFDEFWITSEDALPNVTIGCKHENTAILPGVNATCTEPGLTEGMKCEDCGTVLIAQEEVAATGHDIVTDAAKAPTCTETGLTEGCHCSRCDYKVAQEEIPALGHDYAAVITEPTCTEGGYTTYTCTRCDDSYVADETAALGHDYVDGICSRCGAEDPDAKDPCEGYTDIDRSKWYHDAADFVIERGLMGSTKTNALTFEPNTPCTRSMIVMILYNIAGTPDVSYTAKFPDVPNGQWYTKAVMWAYQNGIVSGYDNGKFGPNDQVTREQMAVVLKGYADFIGKDTSKTADLSKFPDGNKATWSKSYISWAVAEGLINGKAQDGQTYLDPQGVATRAEVAALIRSFVLNILEAK